MNNKYLYIPCSLCVLFLLLMTGCVKHELEMLPGEKVRITYDWKNLADASLIPSGMQLWFYGADNVSQSRQSSSVSYEGVLPVGNYRVLIFNKDVTGVNFRNMDRFEDAEAYLLTDEQGILAQPSGFYGVSLPAFTVAKGQFTDITVAPVTYSRTIILQVKVSGEHAASVQSMQATIEGVAARLNLATGRPSTGDNGKIMQALTESNSQYNARFSLFGGDDLNPGKLMLTVTMSDGSVRTVSEDITEALRQLNSQQANVPLTITLTLDMTQVDGVFVGVIQDWNFKSGEVDVN